MVRYGGRGHLGGLLVLFAATAFGGCGNVGGPAVSTEPVFYPPAPDRPRYQFLTSFSTAAPWVPQQRSRFADFVLGAPKTTEPQSGQISSPFNLAVRDGKLYVCDLGEGVVHVIDFVGGSYTTLGDSRTILHPQGIAIAPDGTCFVADGRLRRVAVFDARDQFVGHIGDPKTISPIDLAAHGEGLFVVDRMDKQVKVWDRQGRLLRTIGSEGVGPDRFEEPFGIAIDSRGQVYVTDMFAREVKVFDVQGRFLRTVGEAGDRPGYFGRPKGIAVDPSDRLYVTDTDWDVIYVFSPEGQLLTYLQDRTETEHQMLHQTGLAIDASPRTLKAFAKHVAPRFAPEYLVFSANQLGRNKITVLAFGGPADSPDAGATGPTGPDARPSGPSPEASRVR